MSKIETARQLAQTQSAERVEQLASQMQRLQNSKIQSVEELAQMIEPLAQAIAALTDESRQTLEQIDKRSKATGQQIEQQHKALTAAISAATAAAAEIRQEAKATNLKIWAGAILTGVAAAALTTGLLLWLAPTPQSVVNLDPEAVAQHLAPAVAQQQQLNARQQR